MKIKRIVSIFLLGSFLASGLIGCNESEKNSFKDENREKVETDVDNKEPKNRKITDMLDEEVEIPNIVKSTGTSWPGFCSVVYTVGGSDKLKVIPKALENYEWAYKLYPEMEKMSQVFRGKETNIEELINVNPDVLLLRGTDNIEKIEETGIPIVMIEYKNNSISDINKAVVLAGSVLGKEEERQGQRYKKYSEEKIQEIKEKAKDIKEEDKKKVLYLSIDDKKLSVWGNNMPQTEAIELSGGINVAAEEVNGFKDISPEQVLAWNPDIIVVETDDKQKNLYDNEIFSSLKAVQNNQIYTSPVGVFAWTRLGSESILQLQWIAKTMYPDIFDDIDIYKETKDFYTKFFNYELKDEDIDLILEAKRPK